MADDDDEKKSPEVEAALEIAGQQFDEAALSLAATPVRSTRFMLLPSGEKEAVLVFGGTMVAKAGEVLHQAFNLVNSISFNRRFATDLSVLLAARFNLTPDEIAASKKRLKITD